MVPALFYDLFPKVVLTLIGPLKSGLDTFRSWDVMIPVLFQVLVRKVVLTLIEPLKSGLEWRCNVLSQQGCRAAYQVLHKSNSFLQHGCRAAHQVLKESNLCQQYGCRADLPCSKLMKLSVTASLRRNLSSFKKSNLAAKQPAKF